MTISNEEQSRVLTLVFTDLADSTGLKTAHGDRAVGELIARHREHVTRLAAECTGRAIDWAGDGCFLTFEISSAAVLFALRLQQVHAEESDLPAVRIGIHMGEVTEKPNPEGDDKHPRIEGLAVDLAARIQGLAKPGQVLMSSAVYYNARQRLGVDAFGKPVLWQTYGDYSLKGFDDPLDICEAGIEGLSPLQAPDASEKAYPLVVASHPEVEVVAPRRTGAKLLALATVILIVAGLGAAYWFGRTAQPAPGSGSANEAITSLAVLPLENLMNDPEQDYFVDGMTEAITAELSKIKALKVISRTSVMRYKGTTKPIPEIATQLGVEGLIEGSVFREGDEVRITVQLIDGRTATHVWSETYTNAITSVLKLQSDVALAIAEAIGTELTPDEQARITRDDLVDREAYDAYLKAWELIDLTTEESLNRALAYLKHAQEIDPDMAAAWAAEARVHWVFAIQVNLPMSEQIEKVRIAASRALALDETQFFAHVGMGHYAQIHDADWDTAKRHFERAVELNPNEPLAWFYLGVNRNLFGQWAEGIKAGDEIVRLSAPASYERALASVAFMMANDSERALEVLRGIDPLTTPTLPWMFSNVYRHLNDTENAIKSARESRNLAVEAEALALAGREQEAREVLERISALDETEARRLARDSDVAGAYIWLGDLEAAFARMERADRSLSRQWLASLLREAYLDGRLNDPRWIAFRHDPRYWDFVERLRLPPLPPDHPGYEEEQAWRARKAESEASDAPITKIAVLPFDNLMGDPEQDYFVDGMTEALITQLAQIKSLQVRGRTSVLRYKDTTETIPEIARELNVDGIIEGSVLREGEQVRITAQLIHGPSDTHRWAGNFDATLTNILQLHSEIALAIADEVRANLTPEEKTQIANAELVNREAYDLYLQGWGFGGEFSPEGLEKRLDCFVRATEIDPNFAPAWVGRAVVHNVIASFGFGPPGAHYEALKNTAERARELDSTLPRIYGVLAFYELARRWDWDGARASYDKSVALDPNSPNSHFIRAFFRLHTGDWAGADDDALMALDLDPHSPLAQLMGGFVLANTHDRPRGFNVLETLVKEQPQNQLGKYWLSSSYARAGEAEAAVRVATQLSAALPGNPQVQVNLAYCLSFGDERQREQARELVKRLDSVPLESLPAPLLGIYYANIGELDDAFQWFERATTDPNMVLLTSLRLSPLDPAEYPHLDRFYRDARYWELVERLHFPSLPTDHPLYPYERERTESTRAPFTDSGRSPERN